MKTCKLTKNALIGVLPKVMFVLATIVTISSTLVIFILLIILYFDVDGYTTTQYIIRLVIRVFIAVILSWLGFFLVRYIKVKHKQLNI